MGLVDSSGNEPAPRRRTRPPKGVEVALPRARFDPPICPQANAAPSSPCADPLKNRVHTVRQGQNHSESSWPGATSSAGSARHGRRARRQRYLSFHRRCTPCSRYVLMPRGHRPTHCVRRSRLSVSWRGSGRFRRVGTPSPCVKHRPNRLGPRPTEPQGSRIAQLPTRDNRCSEQAGRLGNRVVAGDPD